MKMTPSPILSTLGGLALSLGLAGGAQADPLAGGRDPSGADRFPISVESIEAKRASLFAEVDENGDGLVSRSEFMAFEPERDHHRFTKGFHGMPPGPPGEGRERAWSEEKLSAMDDALFEALDSNGDGTLARSEFSQAALLAARHNEMKEVMFDRLDADADGYLSPGEFPPSHFASLDANGDGEITRDEAHQLRHSGPG